MMEWAQTPEFWKFVLGSNIYVFMAKSEVSLWFPDPRNSSTPNVRFSEEDEIH